MNIEQDMVNDADFIPAPDPQKLVIILKVYTVQ